MIYLLPFWLSPNGWLLEESSSSLMARLVEVEVREKFLSSFSLRVCYDVMFSRNFSFWGDLTFS